MKSKSLRRSKKKDNSIRLKSYQHRPVDEVDSARVKASVWRERRDSRDVRTWGVERVGSGGFDVIVGDEGHENYVHCAMLGDGMVGKTCLTVSYTQQYFTDHYTATVFDSYAVPLTMDREEFVISLFDTAGQSDYESVRAYTYNSSEVLVLCFSVCDRESFYSVINSWLPEIQRHTKGKRPLLLVGTQTDLRSSSCLSSSPSQDHVSTEEGNNLAKTIGADCYIECSARSQEGLQKLFEQIVFSALKFRKKKSSIFYRLFGR